MQSPPLTKGSSPDSPVYTGERFLDPRSNVDRDLQNSEAARKKQSASDLFSIICAGFALISDGLQNNIFSITSTIFGLIYGSKVYTSTISTRIGNSLTVGTILGQVFIGIICDRVGRKAGIVLSTFFLVCGIILATAAHGAHGSAEGFFWFFTVARGMTGVGLGGEYPSSSVAAAEAANDKMPKQRGPTFIMVTNFVLSFGGPFACILYLIVFSAAGGATANLNTVWRVVFGISMVPPLAVFAFRLKMLNSKLYQRSAIRKPKSWSFYKLVVRFYWKSLIGTAGAWFLYDFVTFPNGLFSSTIIASLIHATGPEKIIKTAEWQLLLGTLALPGVIVGAFLCNRIGRRNTMMVGFGGYLVIGLTVGLAYNKLINVVPAFVVLYGLMQSSGNLGPGDMLGLISTESYATAVRGSLYGFSAAIGKVGAVVGTQSFTPIQNHLGKRYTFIVAACCGVAGMLVTFFFVRNDLDRDLAEEDRLFEAYLISHGFEGEIGYEDASLVKAAAEDAEKQHIDSEEK